MVKLVHADSRVKEVKVNAPSLLVTVPPAEPVTTTDANVNASALLNTKEPGVSPSPKLMVNVASADKACFEFSSCSAIVDHTAPVVASIVSVSSSSNSST